jgi:hypothetical protein
MSKAYVTTPKGQIVSVQHKNGKSTMELKWNKGFSSRINSNYQNVQEYVDSTVIRYMTPYTPMLNGILYKSAILGTTIGSGQIIQVAPHARYQYYGKLMVSRITGSAYAVHGESKVLTNTPLNYNTFRHPLAGPMWFHRMKADKKDIILRGAQRIISR